MHLKRLFLEYGGLDFGRVTQDAAIDASFEKDAILAIQCPTSGYWATGDPKNTYHSTLLQDAQKKDVRDFWFALRAYWVPTTGRLILYQMQTPNNQIVDPPESVITKLIDNLGISKDIMSIDIVE